MLEHVRRGLLEPGTMLQNVMRALCAPGFLLCATLCATLCAGRIYYARHYAQRLQHCNTLCADYARLVFYYAQHYVQHHARSANIMRELFFCTPPCLIVYAACLRLSNNPSFARTHHGKAEPANATTISCHSQVEAGIISRIIWRTITSHNVAHNNYSLKEMTPVRQI